MQPSIATKKHLAAAVAVALLWACSVEKLQSGPSAPSGAGSSATTAGLGGACTTGCGGSEPLKCATANGDCPSNLCLVDPDRLSDGHLTYCTIDCTTGSCPAAWHCEDIKSFGDRNVTRACVADDESSFTSEDAGSGDAGAGCNFTPQKGATVPPSSRPVKTPPTGTGGVIVDGTYVLLSVIFYGEDSPGARMAETLEIQGDLVNIVGGTAMDQVRTTYIKTKSGQSLVLKRTCLAAVDGKSLADLLYPSDRTYETYTATPTELRLYVPEPGFGGQYGRELVYAKK
jgi:hypothetical protein